MSRRRALTDEQCKNLAAWFWSQPFLIEAINAMAGSLRISVPELYDAVCGHQLYARSVVFESAPTGICRGCLSPHLRKWPDGSPQTFCASCHKKATSIPAPISAEHIMKNQARELSRSYVRKGILCKEPCKVCGSEKSEMHHPDYSDAANVVWLCRRHHSEAHVAEPMYEDLMNRVRRIARKAL